MPDGNPFPHLPLVQRYQGVARLHGGGQDQPETEANRRNRAGHSTTLRGNAANITREWQNRRAERQEASLPALPEGIPLLLEVDPSLDLEKLRELFEFEIVAEQEDGFVIVAAADIQLTAFLQKVNDFAGHVWGSGNVARIHQLHEDPDLQTRLQRILSEALYAQWPTLQDDQAYLCDYGVSCVGTVALPKPVTRRKRESDRKWAEREAEWSDNREAAYEAWDTLMDQRLEEVRHFVDSYQGTIHDIVSDVHTETRLSDSFTVRIEMPGRGLRDFVLNYPYLFEVTEPEKIDLPQRFREAIERAREEVALLPPPPSAPAVCVIDSGIQEEHYLLEPAIDKPNSRSFLPNRPPTDIADYVSPGGHGTRVAGAVLHGETIPTTGTTQLGCWIQNARVLDNDCNLPDRLFPPAALRTIVRQYHEGNRKTRIFNHSINARIPCRLRHMSAWAAEIDYLSTQYDILLIQSVGNIPSTNPVPLPGICEHLAAGRPHPEYLDEASCRVANPAQSFQALTVGSVAYDVFDQDGWSSLARGPDHPSSFSRSGFGIWGVIKPEVVEFGGDELRDGGNPPTVSTPTCARECYPELVRSTRYPPGPAFDRDEVGTSFAAPKVSRIAARLQEILPDDSCLLYRALIVQSARWPQWAFAAPPDRQASVIRWIGFGIPSIERATTNSDFRTTLITSGERSIRARECHIYQVPIPPNMRNQADEYDVLVEVTLSYTAMPRRTRRNPRRYLSTWVDWKSSRIDERLESFRRRVLRLEEADEEEAEGSPFGWTLEANPNWGTIRGVKRSAGTVQKDWAVIKSNRLPPDFCIAVVGHEGWNADPDATAPYALTVSFEIVGQEIPIYETLRVSVEQLQAEVEAELEVNVQVGANDA